MRKTSMVRVFIYVTLMVLLCIMVIIKKRIITQKRLQSMPSLIREWQEVGKPVQVKKVRFENVFDTVRVTLQGEGNIFRGYVPRAIWKKIKLQQDALMMGHRARLGSVCFLSSEVDMETGLYEVKVQQETKDIIKEKFLIVDIVVTLLDDVIVVPPESLVLDGENIFVWVIRDHHAYQKQIHPVFEGHFGVIVENNLQVDDLLIITGHTKLREGDKVSFDEGGLL